MTLYTEDEYIDKDFKRCPISKEWIKKEDCDSVAEGKGCKNKKDCRVYGLFVVTGDVGSNPTPVKDSSVSRIPVFYLR